MLKSKLFWTQFALLLVVVALYAVGLYWYLFWRIWWYDMPMHFLGGLWVGLCTGWLLEWFQVPRRRDITIFLASLAVGVAWEVFEYAVGLTRGEIGFVFDTAHDLLNDVAGGLLAALIITRLRLT